MSLKKISEMTGVSVSTVGRILREPNRRCSSEEIREHVFSAARKINYVPNDAARRLKTGASNSNDVKYINILITRNIQENSDPFYSELLRLIELEVRSSGCIVSNVWYKEEFSDDKTGKDIESLVKKLYGSSDVTSNGIIIVGKCSTKVLKILKTCEKNIVAVNRNSTNYEVVEVSCDGRKVALTAISYLVKCGHKKIGYVGYCHNESRFKGYQTAHVQFQLEDDIDYIYDTVPNETNGYNAMEYFMTLKNPPTGIFCANDILAIGMLKCLNKHRVKYYNPSVVSSDDIEEAQYTTPMLSTVSMPKAEMVKFALMLLLDRINGRHKTVTKIEIDTKLIIRESCRNITEMQEPEYYI